MGDVKISRRKNKAVWLSTGPYPYSPGVKKLVEDARSMDIEAGRLAFKVRRLRAKLERESMQIGIPRDEASVSSATRTLPCGESEIRQLERNLLLLKHTLKKLEEDVERMTCDDSVALTDELRAQSLELATEREMLMMRLDTLETAKRSVLRQTRLLQAEVLKRPLTVQALEDARRAADAQVEAAVLLARKEVALQSQRLLADVLNARRPEVEAERAIKRVALDCAHLERRRDRAREVADAVEEGKTKNLEWLGSVLSEQVGFCMRALRSVEDEGDTGVVISGPSEQPQSDAA